MMWNFTGDGDYTGQADTVNNVEKVTLDVTSANIGQGITVSVVSNGLASADAQKFAVVVSGNLARENAPTPPTTEMPTNAPTLRQLYTYVTSGECAYPVENEGDCEAAAVYEVSSTQKACNSSILAMSAPIALLFGQGG